jgi:PEGA domain-containing protein
MGRGSEALVVDRPEQQGEDEAGVAAGPRDRSGPGSSRRQQQPVAVIRVARLWPGAERAAAAALPAVMPVEVDPIQDSLEAFGSEAVVVPLVPATATGPVAVPAPAVRPRPARDWSMAVVAARWLGVIALGAAAAAAGAWGYRRQIAAPATGSLTIQTSPAGLAVGIDGRAAGVTPVTLTLAPASYNIQVGSGAQRRDLTVSIVAGSAVLQHLELPAVAAPAPTTGALLVQTEPAGQAVTVDGVERGASPLTIDALAAGDHSVIVRGARGTLRRSVSVKAGETVSLLVAPVAPTTPAPGWLSVQAGARLELREGGKLLGTTETEQIMLAAGNHEIELVNEAAGYRARKQIEILPGQTTSVPVELPFGSVSINAQPWAEVWINNERVGETPIANLSRRIGSYEVVFRHPELGERRESINVTLRQPVRLGVDMRSK